VIEGLWLRIAAALVFVPVLVGLVYVGGQALMLGCLVLSGLMLWEYFRLVFGKFSILGFGLGIAVVLVVLGELPARQTLPVLLLGALIWTLLRPGPIEKTFNKLGLTILGALYCGGLISHLVLLRRSGLGLALMALVCTWLADTAAYFTGKAIGKHKLYPQVSPGKTVEGVVGGMVGAVATAFLIRTLFSLTLETRHVVALGILAGMLSVVGDLCESLLKRGVGAKDSSHLIPGHGGVLDRFDALMFVAPAFYIYATLFLGAP
jgi:phosphatidate cytidylyltransferase